MQFEIKTEDMNQIIAYSKALHAAKDDRYPLFGLVQCKLEGTLLTAEFINYHACAMYQCKVKNTDSGHEEFYLAPPEKKFSLKKDGTVVTVDDLEHSTTYTTLASSQTLPKTDYSGRRFDTKMFWDRQPEAVLYVSPDRLHEILGAYIKRGDKAMIKLEFLGEKQGLKISMPGEDKTFLLPMASKKGW